MSSKVSQPWVPLEKIESFVQIEPALFILGLALSAWFGSQIFFRNLSGDRRRSLKGLFRNLSFHLILGAILFLSYTALQHLPYENQFINRLITYLGLCTILSGATIFVKVWRILVFQYFFLSHMKVAFPVLLVNLFTLLLSMILAGWISTEIFNVRLAPLLATSAIFSLVLGLALQDTLGNLFSGVALQFDKSYEIGDWIEVQNVGQKWVGQVYEISWRATILIAPTEEIITIPNRIMGQAQIANFSTKYRPIIRSHVFKLPYQHEINGIKSTLLKAANLVPEIRKSPSPLVLVAETTESWIGFKLVYYIDNYGNQFVIADRVFSECLSQLKKAGYELSGTHVRITKIEPEETKLSES